MYAYIKGTLEYKGSDYIVVEANGVGYRVNTALSTIQAAGSSGDRIQVFTHLYVREDAMSLFGFLTHEELGMFELLITVSGVGPKAALALISAVSPSKFGLAVITDDTKSLTKAQGIGTKIAQRIILELKDKMKKEQLPSINGIGEGKLQAETGGSRATEAISALMVLGYTPVEASRAVSSVFSEDMDIESIIKNALRGLARG